MGGVLGSVKIVGLIDETGRAEGKMDVHWVPALQIMITVLSRARYIQGC